MKEETTSPNGLPGKPRYMVWLRTLFGFCILTAIFIWVINEGVLLERLSVRVLIISTLVSILTSLVHAVTLRSIANTYERVLQYRSALYITSVGSLGNAAGGLPLGTTLKYLYLYKKVGLRIVQITFGLTTYTLLISLILLVYATISGYLLNVQSDIETLITILLVVGILTTIALGYWGSRNSTFSYFIDPFLKFHRIVTALVLSTILASTFIINSCVVGYLLFPEHTLLNIIFLSATGIFIGLISFLQTIGGIQEITMGISAYLSGLDSIDGVQIALVMRFTAIFAALIILGFSYLLPKKHA